ncbi:hypothetical protein F3K40_17100 [Streptomyces sp. LBUM 1478]|nr:hypothetical protein [Streptomyces sp. LBUM 1484]MBP5877077.1 hypothetical protein [Streptomyces sp. LBUM 1477]MBP5884863.1 hypothetical protein [Streptomyces sp. LBUM 1487]MBP5900827.1 hypothetical protein [Streptomyces sp. LBUM 1488]MBP5907100.1 hypothetical protein [Streptomyces sp. LBUM 1478]MBP5930062.1 hypothetical protein [Streptomyces sp. LBUM 1479]QTU51080.1 hypothetical protein F3K20_22760 [Streptomyces sp. LBUM 1482]QTU67232.1 hypothetical protein F3K22_21490 [Streptomyces sp. 
MAPTPGRPVVPATPDVFSERTHALANRIVPVALGLVYGYWAAAMNRDAGPITGWNVLFGLVTAFVFAALHIAVLTVAPRLRRELHAALWAAFAGCAFGFLYSQASQHSVLRSVAMSLAVAAGFLVVNFYRYYTHEDATGHRLR